jgi:Lrp/AsnC family transcriptional regulator, leucine-responsive regulatory protein
MHAENIPEALLDRLLKRIAFCRRTRTIFAYNPPRQKILPIPPMNTRNRSLDTLDRKIMRELQKNARLSNAELAELVGMSTTACWNRTRQLENEGYIRGYVALLDQQKLGFADVVLLEVTLDRHDEDALARFGAELATLSEVLEAYLVSGDYDYLVKVAVDGTAGYERFLREKLYKIAGIRHSRSMFALRCMKSIPSIAI